MQITELNKNQKFDRKEKQHQWEKATKTFQFGTKSNFQKQAVA